MPTARARLTAAGRLVAQQRLADSDQNVDVGLCVLANVFQSARRPSRSMRCVAFDRISWLVTPLTTQGNLWLMNKVQGVRTSHKPDRGQVRSLNSSCRRVSLADLVA